MRGGSDRVYLDWNATAPLAPAARAAMLAALEVAGNPSSVHGEGRRARAITEAARREVAALVGADAAAVVFTSGGTEANVTALAPIPGDRPTVLVVSAVEHPSVAAGGRFPRQDVRVAPVDGDGVIDLAALATIVDRAAGEGARPLVALMLANNETGVVQPVAEAAELVRAAGGWLHVDAIQAAGKMRVDSRAIGADTLSISAHKLGGPMGVGALTFGPRATMVRVQHGGGQERGRRSGTENIPGISGFGAAAKIVSSVGDPAWRDAVASRLKRAGGVVLGENEPRLPNTLCIAMPGWDADRQVMALDLTGVMISAGSACSSGKVKASHVLTAMGHAELAGCAIRVSGGWDTTEEDWNRFADAWLEAHARHAARRKEVA